MLVIYAVLALFGGAFWLCVPFLLLGIRKQLGDLAWEQRRTNALLSAMATPAQRDYARELEHPEQPGPTSSVPLPGRLGAAR